MHILLFSSNDTPTTEIYTLSLHDALPISKTKIAIDFLYTDDGHILCKRISEKYKLTRLMVRGLADRMAGNFKDKGLEIRSEEHTSELQSRFDLVCRLLLEKKKKKIHNKQ